LDEDELMLVLAHEMGHALGIGHVDNPQSVMYRLMGNQARPGLELTEDDRYALMDICNNNDSTEWSAH
jgi:predicted Zn-dependent protease